MLMHLLRINSLTDHNKLLVNIFLFACVCMIICFFSNLYFCSFIMSDSLLNRAEHQLKANLKNTKIIAFGDSHPTRAFNPMIVKNSFNYGSHGENYVQTYYKLKKLLEKENNIELVLIQMDLHNFYDNFQEGDNMYFWKDYIDPYELGIDSGSLIKTYPSYLFKSNFVSYLSGLSIVFESFVRNSGEILKMGFQPKPSLRRLTKEYLEQRINGHFKKDKEYISRRSLKYFHKILGLLKEKGIKAALIRYPVSKYYYNAARQRIQESTFQGLLENTKKQYPNVDLFLDFSKVFFNDDMTDLRKSVFYDHDHVNIYGANILSKNICEIIENHYKLCH